MIDSLKLENQLCFPLYAAARGIVKKYTPLLKSYGLTYTQYITLMVLWDKQQISVKELGEALYLDSGTLTPLLKKLESMGLVTRTRSKTDERILVVAITDKGNGLKSSMQSIPAELAKCIDLEAGEAAELYRLLYKLLGQMHC